VDRIEAMKTVLHLAKMKMFGAKHESAKLVEEMIQEAEAADADPKAKAKLAFDVLKSLGLPAEAMLVLSTSHLHQATADKMQYGSLPLIQYDHDEYGWQVNVPSDEPAWLKIATDCVNGDIPDDLFLILEFARERGFEWVLFDADAETVSGLPTFSW
jgi:hypothetical protein